MPACVQHENQQNQPHGASDWYREGSKVGGRGINPGHTYSLPWEHALIDDEASEAHPQGALERANRRPSD
jgi:hypothetical protein